MLQVECNSARNLENKCDTFLKETWFILYLNLIIIFFFVAEISSFEIYMLVIMLINVIVKSNQIM